MNFMLFTIKFVKFKPKSSNFTTVVNVASIVATYRSNSFRNSLRCSLSALPAYYVVEISLLSTEYVDNAAGTILVSRTVVNGAKSAVYDCAPVAVPRWGRRGGAQAPPNRGWAPKFSRTLYKLWSIDYQKN